MTQNVSTAVMARRVEPHHSLDFFPTPPWATRALFKRVLPELGFAPPFGHMVDPCCGQGHMAAVLAEAARAVTATDIFDYGYPLGVSNIDFLNTMVHSVASSDAPDWYIFNPPFKIAAEFVLRALDLAKVGVAALCRLQWIEGQERYEALFRPYPEAAFAPFVERVPMISGRWDPDASTATSYAWFVWTKVASPRGARILRIAPCARDLTRPDDRKRFAAWSVTPQDDARVEAIARELYLQEEDARFVNANGVMAMRDTMTYRERMVFDGKDEKAFAPRWRAYRRRADDIIAGELTAAAL